MIARQEKDKIPFQFNLFRFYKVSRQRCCSCEFLASFFRRGWFICKSERRSGGNRV